MKKDTGLFVWVVVAALLTVLQVCAAAQENEGVFWPKEILIDGGTVIMYQLQPEKLEGNLLESRAAISIEFDKGNGPVFGAIWFDTRLNTDRDERTATIADVSVKDVRFPEQTEEDTQKLKALLEKEIPRWDLVIDMDRLLATLDLADKRDIAAQRISTAPPRIIFTSEPAVLVMIDGEPRLESTENPNLMRVKNTPFTLLLSLSEKRYYLFADKGAWYISDDIKENWKIADSVPSEVAKLAPKPGSGAGTMMLDEGEEVEPGPPPVVFVSTEPAEIIVSIGKPEYTPISGTDLLYMSNTDSDVLMHIVDQQFYVLLSGRWYRSVSLQGPWVYVAGGDLPADFSRIPEDSQVGTVLYAVPGTDVAREAVLDAYIPQTAAIDPDKAALTIEYDGKPEFEPIPGTYLYYAVNTAIPVIWTGQGYYACEQAVWFVAPTPKGPWTVATSVPDSIYLIPPESPVYNVTFVRVYQATPEVVYVGYTPGYTNSYVYYDTIVYGTGYHWPGWYGRYYYPRPCTWGFHARWNPWSGWGFGISYGISPFYFSIGYGDWYRGGWWGPSYYRGYRHGYYHRYRREKHIGYRAGYVPGGPHRGGTNIYRSQRNKVRLIPIHDKPYLKAKKHSVVPRRENNVYVDRDGNIHRKTDEGWQTRKKDKWLQLDSGKPIQTRPATGPVPVQRPKYGSGKPIQTRPATGPVPVQRPKYDSGRPIETRPATGPVPVQRPKYDSGRPIETRPATGPVPVQRPKYDSGKPIQTRPATGPVPSEKPQRTKRDWGTQQMDAPQLDRNYRARQQGENRARSFNEAVGPKGMAPPPGGRGGGGKPR